MPRTSKPAAEKPILVFRDKRDLNAQLQRWSPAKLQRLIVRLGALHGAHAQTPQKHNVILFVADGLRSQIVTPETAPALANLRAEGVDFQNSHAVFPTVTTANASAMATGHYLGDSGDFGNYLYTGPKNAPETTNGVTPSLEDDADLNFVNAQFGGNYLNEDTLLAQKLISQLMEDTNAEARRAFLAEHARKIRELDV